MKISHFSCVDFDYENRAENFFAFTHISISFPHFPNSFRLDFSLLSFFLLLKCEWEQFKVKHRKKKRFLVCGKLARCRWGPTRANNEYNECSKQKKKENAKEWEMEVKEKIDNFSVKLLRSPYFFPFQVYSKDFIQLNWWKKNRIRKFFTFFSIFNHQS